MDDLMSPGGRASLIERIKAILLKPKETWPVIAGEAATPQDLVTRYALPLIVLSALAGFIGMQVFGFSVLGMTYRPGLVSGLTSAVISVVMGVVAVVAVSLFAEWLAPKFGGVADRTQAFKLVVYSMTAGWIGGLLAIYPAIAMLGALAGLYGLYLLYLGATTLMKVPEDKAVGFTAVTVICAAVAIWVSALVVAMVTGGAMMAGGMAASPGEVSGELKIPGVGSVDMGKLEAATKQMEAAASGAAGSGAAAAVAPSAMQALLPTAIGGWQRTSVESASAGNIGGTAAGTYSSGDRKFELRIVDMSALGALAGIGAAMGVEANREDADGYERTGTVNGAMQIEEWNRTRSRGKFARMIGNRFMIEAEGDAGSIDELKAAVAAIDAAKLAGMVK
jgi:Yip1 domain